MELTQDILKQILDYNPEIGLFTWKVSYINKIKVGNIAGCKNKVSGYIQVRINKKKYYAHRLAWLYITGHWPKVQIDHINHIRYDNRWSNLHEATHQNNNKNKSMQNNNISGFTGVHWNKALSRWRATININSKKYHIGYFDNLEDAVTARIKANLINNFHENHGI